MRHDRHHMGRARDDKTVRTQACAQRAVEHGCEVRGCAVVLEHERGGWLRVGLSKRLVKAPFAFHVAPAAGIEEHECRPLPPVREQPGHATSTDGGATWSAISHEPQLPCAQCQASLFRYSWPDASGPGRLLFCNPFRPELPAFAPSASRGTIFRQRMTVRLSNDEGKTWPFAKRLHEKFSGYSSLVRLSDDSILCLYEGGEKTRSEFIRLARFNLEWLTNE